MSKRYVCACPRRGVLVPPRGWGVAERKCKYSPRVYPGALVDERYGDRRGGAGKSECPVQEIEISALAKEVIALTG